MPHVHCAVEQYNCTCSGISNIIASAIDLYDLTTLTCIDLEHAHWKLHNIINLRACARGKEIGFVHLSVCCLSISIKIAGSQDLLNWYASVANGRQ